MESPRITGELIRARNTAAMLRRSGGVNLAGIGYRYKNGARTDQVVIVVGVEKKWRPHDLAEREVVPVPRQINAVPTDVIEYGRLVAPREVEHGAGVQAFTARKRPCPPGYSSGHYRITAGTMGAWLRKLAGEDYYALSNNHVYGDSNAARLGDDLLQPGPHDGGDRPQDVLGHLAELVTIHFGDEPPNGGGDKKGGKDPRVSGAAHIYWSIFKGPANWLAELSGCDWRLQLRPNSALQSVLRGRIRQIPQDWPNLVDAALMAPIEQSDVSLDAPSVGPIQGLTDLVLGQEVQKSGRTTEYTRGAVEVIGATAIVSYGSVGDAHFQDQVVIRGKDGSEFSAGGDSGSGIFDMQGRLGALLFAGGNGVTIANRIQHVIRYLELRQ